MIRVVPWQNPTLSSTHFQQTLETKWNLKKWSFLNLFFFKLKTTKTQWHHKGNKQRLQGLVSNACFVFKHTISNHFSDNHTCIFMAFVFIKKKKNPTGNLERKVRSSLEPSRDSVKVIEITLEQRARLLSADPELSVASLPLLQFHCRVGLYQK